MGRGGALDMGSPPPETSSGSAPASFTFTNHLLPIFRLVFVYGYVYAMLKDEALTNYWLNGSTAH